MVIKYGFSNRFETTSDRFSSVSAVLTSPDLRGILGFPENVGALVNGVDADASQTLENDDVIELVTKANKKG
jgi:hypothetical protein